MDYEKISGVKTIYDMHRYLTLIHKKKQYYKMSYYPSCRSSSNNIKVGLDLSNYATKDDVTKVEDKVNENKKEIIFIRGFFFI